MLNYKLNINYTSPAVFLNKTMNSTNDLVKSVRIYQYVSSKNNFIVNLSTKIKLV